MNRKGLGKGLGMGYKNIVPMDTHIHSLSAKGVKTLMNPKAPAFKNKDYVHTIKDMQVYRFIIDRATGKSYPRIKYGDEIPYLPEYEYPKWCPDCAVAKGVYHHPSCDIEQSPLPSDQYIDPKTKKKMNGQLLSSDNAGDLSTK